MCNVSEKPSPNSNVVYSIYLKVPHKYIKFFIWFSISCYQLECLIMSRISKPMSVAVCVLI